jgi:hypothetical protein
MANRTFHPEGAPVSAHGLLRGIAFAMLASAALAISWQPASALGAQGPIAAYSFDAGEGTTLEDVTGNGHDGTIEGASWTTHGKYGGALEFDGEDDCISIPESTQLQFLEEEEFTLEAWVRPQNGEQIQAILTQEDDSPAGSEEPFSYSLLVGGEEAPKGWLRKSGESGHVAAAGGDPLPLNAWSHIAFTDNGAKLRLYVDGELVAEQAALPLAAAEGPASIGCLANYGNYFDGRIDEVRIYNRALDAGEVAADKAAPIQTPPATPVAAYSFDAGEGTTLEDVTGNGHEGTIEGGQWTRGKYGGALSFDGEDDVVTIPTSPDLDLEEFTLEAWVKPNEIHPFSPVIAKTDPEDFGYELMAGGDGEPALPEAFITNGKWTYRYAYGSEQLPLHAWSHIAVTSDGDKMRFYVNGELVNTRAGANVLAGGGVPLQIGGNESLTSPDFFKGLIDEVRIYNRALDAGEVAADKAAPIQTPPATPVAAYSFDAGEGATLEDVTGNEHEGAIEGASWFANGRFGSALHFDGADDCVSVPDSTDLQLGEEFSLEAWVKPEGEGENEPILIKEDPEWFGYSLYLGLAEDGALEGYLGEEGNVTRGASDPTLAERHVWSHIAFTFDGARIRLYVDGQLVDGTTADGAMPTAGQLSIGCSKEGEQFFHGKIDEVRIYDRALSADELAADMSAALPSPPTAATGEAEVLGPSEAILMGTVDPDETETRYRFEYGTTTGYGQTAPATEEEVLYENTDQEAEEAVAYLQPNTTYHYRLVATNRAGTAVGEDKILTTPPSEVSPEQEQQDRKEEEHYTASISTLPPDFVGLNFRGLQERTNADMEKVAETGASMYRISLEDLTQFSVERSKYDEVFLNAAANHMKVLFVLGSRHLTTNKSGLATWVERIVRRYGKARAGKEGSIWSSEKAPYAPTSWEVWNEPNIGLNSLNPPPKPDDPNAPPANQRPGNLDPKKFGDYLEVMSKAIKDVEPNATVILGSLVLVGTKERHERDEKKGKEDQINPEKFLSKMGHPDAYDAVGFHPYVFKASNGKAPEEGPEEGKEINEVRMKVRTSIVRLRKKLDHVKGGENKQLWITEVGWPVGVGDQAHPAVSQNIQAKLLESVFSTIKKRAKPWNIANVFYFNYRDAPRSARQAVEWDLNTGLLDPEGVQKPSFEAFQLQAK